MQIETVEAKAVAVPLAIVTSMSTRAVRERHYVLVWIRSNDGVEGTGFTYAGTFGGRLVRDVINDLLAPMLLGRPRVDIEALWAEMYQEAILIGRRGAVIRAISAIDIALHDAMAKAADLPLAQMLGGAQESVAAYASGGYYREGDPLKAVADEITRNRELGFGDHKIKVGGLTVAQDAERVRIACRNLGPGGRLALDANNAYKTAAEAIVAAREFERAADPHPLWWFEEPLSPEDIEGHAAIARAIPTPVATGEIHQTRWDFRLLLESRAAAILQHDAAVAGGIAEWRRISALASTFGVCVAPHWNANLHVHLAAATPDCLTVEHFDLDKDVFNFERLVTEETRLRPADGRISVPRAAGLGFDWDRRAIASFEFE